VYVGESEFQRYNNYSEGLLRIVEGLNFCVGGCEFALI
jgi:hypothetical protein